MSRSNNKFLARLRRQFKARKKAEKGLPPLPKAMSLTICRGYEGHDCNALLKGGLGILEPRCPRCYRKHIELSKV